MSTLLFEIGTEELPASFLDRALQALPELATAALADARIRHGELAALGTPRRLALMVHDVAERQDDLQERVQGPPASVAFTAAGELTQAGLKFAEKQQVDPSGLHVVDTEKGPYVVAERYQPGSDAKDVLADVLQQIAERIPFPKTMRWGDGEFAFGRPVHWLVALLDAQTIAMQFAGAHCARESRGHRFMNPHPVPIAHAKEYAGALKAAHVVVSGDERCQKIAEQLLAAANELEASLVEDPALVAECSNLVEEPKVIAGAFEDRFLELPEEVIIAVMRGHQRYFALRDPESGKLRPSYLTVANTAQNVDKVRRGNERVIRARLQDAMFFHDEDLKKRLEDRLPALNDVVFQAKLGSLGQKTQRIVKLVEAVAQQSPTTVAPQQLANAQHAARLAKVDLVTQMVGEFPELQGIMGRWYALKQGLDPQVADALRDHYLPKSAKDEVPSQAEAALVGLADRIDTLVGCFGVGLVPTGSADPFALRRAAVAVLRLALAGPVDVPLVGVLGSAYDLYPNEVLRAKEATLAQLDEFFRARLRSLYSETADVDVVEACLSAWPSGSIRDLDARIRALAQMRSQPEFAELATAFKRTFNITKDVGEGGLDPALFQDEAERQLAHSFQQLRPRMEAAISKGDYPTALTAAAHELHQPIHRFFEEVFVMTEDSSVRQNRLQLLAQIARTLTQIADFRALTV